MQNETHADGFGNSLFCVCIVLLWIVDFLFFINIVMMVTD